MSGHANANSNANANVELLDMGTWLKNNSPQYQHQLTQSLQETLHSHGVFEGKEGNLRRLQTLNTLEGLLSDWSDSLLPVSAKVQVKVQVQVQVRRQTQSDDDSSLGCGASATQEKARLISFGSYRLGVHSPSADLDLLAVCPPHISRETFFSSFVDILNNDERATSIHPISGAFTPVLKFYMDGIPIDMLFVQLENGAKLQLQLQLPQKRTLLNSSQPLVADATAWTSSRKESMKSGDDGDKAGDGEDDGDGVTCGTSASSVSSSSIAAEDQFVEGGVETILCSNAPVSTSTSTPISESVSASASTIATLSRDEFQVDDTMLQGLDEKGVRSLNGARVAQYLLAIIPDPEKYRTVLKTVKQWAVVHGLYSNVLGFLGGINWAILVAWVCKHYPTMSPAILLKIFFHTFSNWEWPTPVTLTEILYDPPLGVRKSLPVWMDGSNNFDKTHIMPIITPCFPSMNSCYNVGVPQRKRITQEFAKASKIMDEIANGNGNWGDLLKQNTFFKDHPHYIRVSISAPNEADHRAWFGFCESKLRILIAPLDSQELKREVYPFAKFFTQTLEQEDENGSCSTDEINNSKDEDRGESCAYVSSPSTTTVIESNLFIGLQFVEKRIDLKPYTYEFCNVANNWTSRKDGMDIKIETILQSELPTFVSDQLSPGEMCLQDSELRADAGTGTGAGTGNETTTDIDVDTNADSRKKEELDGATSLNDLASPDDCLASPLKRAKISKD